MTHDNAMPPDAIPTDGRDRARVSQPSRRRRWLRWWIGTGLLGVMFLALLPTLLGSRWVIQGLVNRLKLDGFAVEIEAAELGWFRPIAFRGIRLKQVTAPKLESTDLESKPRDLIRIAAIESNRSMLGYVLGGRDLGQLRIREPKIDIELLENTSNLERLVQAVTGSGPAPQANRKRALPRLDLEISVEQFSVAVSGDAEGQLLVVPPFDAHVHYRSLDGQARLLISPSRILERVAITPELVRLGLGRAIPLLAKSAWFDGSVSLETQPIEIFLENPEQSTGLATLTLHQVRSGSSEPVVMKVLDMIATLQKTEPVYELVFIDGSKIEIEAADGRIAHRGVQIGLPKIDPRLQITSTGMVGIVDRSLALTLGIPLPIEQFARRESVQELGVPLLSLSIGGTLDQPVVDWNAMRSESSDIMALISAALLDESPGTAAAIDALGAVTGGQADAAIGAAVDLLKQMRLNRQQRMDSQTAPSPDDPERSDGPAGEERRPRRPLRDTLKGILGGK